MTEYDAIVIGGGPGGSAAGTALARAGKKTLLLEKETFPRFHIGESLLPFGNEPLKELGVWEKIQAAGFMPKLGAEFIMGNSTRSHRFWFSGCLTPGDGRTFQVERSKFDHLLLKHAAESGCEVREGARVESIGINEDGGEIEFVQNGEKFSAKARWIFDATGRDTFLGRQLQLPKIENKIPRRIATYAHFKGVFRNGGEAAGHITLIRLEHCWFWMIPLDEEKTSIGLVQEVAHFKASGLEPGAQFEKIVSECSELAARLKNAERVGAYYTTSDYTYRYQSFAGPRYFMIGDAAGFIDPIFSSGVMIALRSGLDAVQCALWADKESRALTAAEQKAYTAGMVKMMKVFGKMIHTYYDANGFEVFMTPAPRFKLPQAVNSILAGNTDLPFRLWWRVKLFYFICWCQKRIKLCPVLNYRDPLTTTS